MSQRQLGWLVGILTAVGGLTGWGDAGAQPLRPAILERLRAATVFVGVLDPQSGQVRASGSGFLVSPQGDVLTAGHLASVPGQLRVVLSSGQPDERRAPAEVTRLDRPCDLALLKTGLKDTPFLKVGDSERLHETEAVTTAGFPLGAMLETDNRGPAPSFRTGVITSMRRSRYGGLVRMEISSGAEAGSSGSPVVNAEGAVVGMVIEVGGRATVLAIPSRRLVGFGGEQLRLEERDRRTLRQWREDPFEQAQALYETGRVPESRTALQPLLKQERDAQRVLDLHAGIEERLGELDAALATYARLLKTYPEDPRVPFWTGRSRQLEGYRGDGDSQNNLVLCSHYREEASVIDAGAGRVLETLRGVRLSTYATYRGDGRYAYTRSPEGLVALDLVIPQEATHLRREHPELGTPDWASASQDGSLVAVAYAPGDVPNPTSSVVVYRGPELREYAVYRFHEFLPKGYVTPDGKAAYVTTLLKSGGGPMVRIQRLDLTTGRLTTLVPETPVITWMAFAADLGLAYALQEDRHVVRIDLASGEINPVATGDTNDIAPAPEPHRLLFGGRELVVWDAGEDRPVQRYPLPFEAYQVGATVNGEYLFAADGYRERVVLIHRATGRVTEIRLHERSEPEVLTSATNFLKHGNLCRLLGPLSPGSRTSQGLEASGGTHDR